MHVQPDRGLVHGYKPTNVKKFIQPDILAGTKGKGKFGSAKAFAKNIGQTLFAKVHQVIHRVLKGEWVNSESIRQSIKANILQLQTDLEARHYDNRDDLEKKLEVRTWIHDSVVNLRLLCDELKKRGVANSDNIDEMTEILGILDQLNDKEGIKEVNELKELELKTQIQEELSSLIQVAYDAKATNSSEKKPPGSFLAQKLGGINSSLNKEFLDLAKLDLSHKHSLFIPDQLRRAWEIIRLGYGNEAPPNDVLVKFTEVKNLVEMLTNTQKVTDQYDPMGLAHIKKMNNEPELRKMFKEEMQAILDKEGLNAKRGWFKSEPVVLSRIRKKDYGDKGPLDVSDIRELQKALNEVYRKRGKPIPDGLYDKLAGLYEVVETLNSINVKAANEAESEPTFLMTVPSRPKSEEDLREKLEDSLYTFVLRAYGDAIVPGSELQPISFLEKKLGGSKSKLNQELRSIGENVNFKTAHPLFIIDQTNRAIKIVKEGFEKSSEPMPIGVVEQLFEISHLLKFLGDLNPTPPQIREIREPQILLNGIQKIVGDIIVLQNKAFEEWKIKRGVDPLIDRLEKENHLKKGPEEVMRDTVALHQAISRQCQSTGHVIPDVIYEHLAFLYELATQLNKLAEMHQQAVIEAAVVPPQDPSQQKERRFIQRELSKLINDVYKNYQIIPPGSKQPVSLVMWELGKKEGINSSRNQELLSMRGTDLENEHNLFVTSQLNRAHELLVDAFSHQKDVLPEPIEKHFDKLFERSANLDNSQKGPLIHGVKSLKEIKAISDPDELKKAFQGQINNLVDILKGGQLFPKRIFAYGTRDDIILTTVRDPGFLTSSNISADEIWTMIFHLQDKIEEALRETNSRPPDFVYDYLAVMYEISEIWVEKEKGAVPSPKMD